MQRFTFFDEASGEWTGVTLDGADLEHARANAPDGTVPVPMCAYPHAKRLIGGNLIEYQPPQPSPDHEWSEVGKHWQLTAAAAARNARKLAAAMRIDELERKQARIIREHLLGDATAQTRLQAIEDEIVQKRRDL